MARILSLLLLVAASGCAKSRDPAPEDLDGIMGFLFQNWEDPEALAEGTGNLSTWLDGEGRTERPSEGYLLSDLTLEQVADVEFPDVPLEEHIGVAAGAVSPWPIEAHAELLVLEDQKWNDPKTYDVYARDVVAGDSGAFTDSRALSLIRTENEIDKKGAFGVHIPYFMPKDYAWVHLEDGRRAIVARSWVPERSCAEQGNNCLNQSFSIDLFYATDDDSTVRLTATWADLTTVVDDLLTEDGLVKMMVDGMVGIFENTDAFLETGGE